MFRYIYKSNQKNLPTMKKISQIELINLLQSGKGISGATFIGIDTVTVPILKGGKANEMQGRIQKCVFGSSVMVFQNKTTNGYENMVKRRLEAEGKAPETFELKARQWGERLPNCPLVEHKGNYYMEVIFLKAGQVKYLFDGKEIDKANIQGLETEREEGEQGGLENKVVIRSYKIASIARITLDKENYIIEN